MPGLLDLFVPKEKKFFQHLEQQMHLVQVAVSLLSSEVGRGVISKKTLLGTLGKLGKQCKEGEKISLQITHDLHQTFITPIDREELQLLTVALCRITDSIEKIAFTLSCNGLRRVDEFFLQQIALLEESITLISQLFEKPLHLEKNNISIQRIKKKEQEADEVYRKAFKRLFQKSADPLVVLKKRELLNIAEEAVDDAKNIGDLFETILINHS